MRGLEIMMFGSLFSVNPEAASDQLLRRRLCAKRMCTRCARVLDKPYPTVSRSHAQLCVAMFNTNDCCKEKAVGYLFPITEPCVDLSSYPDDTTSKRSEDITAQNIVDELESGTLQCDGDKFCEILQKNYDEPVNVECVKKDRSSLVVISMVVLIISLLISAIVGVIYRCQTEKRGLQQKHKQNTKKTNNELPNDQARLIASPSIASPTQSDACLPTKPSYDTFE